VRTSPLPKGTLGSVASVLAATLYQGNCDMNHKLWNIVSSACPNKLEIDRKYTYKVLYNECSSSFDPLTNMAIIVFDWSIPINILLRHCLLK
jgi:hypothetical protein